MGRMNGKGSAGFTLMELLVVVIIIGILATLALPQFPRVIETARQGEARSVLGQLYQAEKVFFAERNTYTNADTTTNPLVVGIPTATDPDHYFTYGVVGGATTFTATATRKTANTSSGRPGFSPPYTITITETGNYTTTGF